MVDFHTHILPGMDDGSRDVSQSLDMLRMERRMGVHTVVLTPHFYASQNDPVRFLERRQKAWEKLSTELGSWWPKFLLGAEVQYFDCIEEMEDIRPLCIGDTGVLLLEMPFRTWDERAVRATLELNERDGIQVVLAHIERYFTFCRKQETWDLLRERGVLMQVNASFFSGFFGKRRAMKMLERGEFQLIGSDCHNTDTRKPNWDLVPEEARRASGEFARKLLRLPDTQENLEE